MNTVPNTLLPWSALFDEAITIRDAQDNQLAILTHIHTRSGGRRSTNEVEANAKLIVTACNEYSSLKSRADAVDVLLEAVDVVLSDEEHAFSGGMCKYQKGSQTWQAYEDLRNARTALARVPQNHKTDSLHVADGSN